MFNSKFMTSQTGKQITINKLNKLLHTYCPISQKLKQSDNKRWKIFFLKNHTPKCLGETSLRPFSKKSKLSISLDLWISILNIDRKLKKSLMGNLIFCAVFLSYLQIEDYQNILRLRC